MYKIYTSEDYDREDLPNNVWCVIRRLNELNLTPDIYDIETIEDLNNIDKNYFNIHNSIIITKTFTLIEINFKPSDTLSRDMIRAQFDYLYKNANEQNTKLEELGFVMYENPISITTLKEDDYKLGLEYSGLYLFSNNDDLNNHVKELMSDYSIDIENIIDDILKKFSSEYDQELIELRNSIIELLKIQGIEIEMESIDIGKGSDSDLYDILINGEEIGKYDKETDNIILMED